MATGILDHIVKAFGCDDVAGRQNIVSLLQRAGVMETQTPAPSSDMVMLNPAVIHVDAPAYQFRSGGDAHGVTNTHRVMAKKWDPILHGDPLLVHQRLDGTLYVADGHHRLELAKRLNLQGIGPKQVAAIVLREADGYSVKDAKIIAAYKNIAHGHTNMLDTARVFKEAHSGKVHTQLLPELDMSKGNLRRSLMLSTALSDGALNEAIAHHLPEEMAMIVADKVHDPVQQELVMRRVGEKIESGYVEKMVQRRLQEAAMQR